MYFVIMNRCVWVNPENREYLEYHDTQWWVPVHDDRELFEMLILEWAQAWLSWETILKKREWYRKAFDNFDVHKIIQYNDAKIQELLQNPWIVRNKLKIHSVVKNAKAVIEIQKEYGSFDAYIWNYVWGRPIKNSFQKLSEIPVETELSRAISKDLKKRGMSFVGPTIIYAYMQAIGIVNDHTVDCFRYEEV